MCANCASYHHFCIHFYLCWFRPAPWAVVRSSYLPIPRNDTIRPILPAAGPTALPRSALPCETTLRLAARVESGPLLDQVENGMQPYRLQTSLCRPVLRKIVSAGRASEHLINRCLG
jgi:hypothetical protein